MLALCALAACALGAAGATSAAPASHDEPVVRAVGLGWTGMFRALDAIVAAPVMLVPIGTRALRAGLASALVTAASGALAFLIARRLAHAVRPATASPHLVSAVSAVAALSAVLAPVWQVEASAPGGSVVGALLVLGAVALALGLGTRGAEGGDEDRLRQLTSLAFVLGLSASYEPLVFAAALVATLPWAEGAIRARAFDRRAFVVAAPALALGLAPLALGLAFSRRAPEIAVSAVKPLASSLGAHAGARVSIGPFALGEIGTLVLVAAAAGVALCLRAPAARRWLASLLGVILVGVLGIMLRVPAGPSHVASVVLAATAAVHVLAAIALVSAVIAISTARVPFAHASAALVVVLELVLPVRAADETLSRRDTRAPRASTIWNEIAWGPAPPAAVLLVSNPATMLRIAAARATGDMRSDLVVVPTFAMPSRAADRALKAEPKLAPLYRDIALGSTPEELSLATLATDRPLLAGFDPRWDRGLARHFAPVGLTTRFEPEPRGVSDRRRGLDAFTPAKDRLVRVAIARRDAELASATATLLRARAIGMAACGERDVLSRALDDLRPFAPDDPVANTLVRRMVTQKGAIDVKDLTP
jgi:hypothetical protein